MKLVQFLKKLLKAALNLAAYKLPIKTKFIIKDNINKNMGVPQFTDIISLSNTEISEAIIETENQLFNLRFKKATRQSFKSHEIKNAKRSFSSIKNTFNIKITKS